MKGDKGEIYWRLLPSLTRGAPPAVGLPPAVTARAQDTYAMGMVGRCALVA